MVDIDRADGAGARPRRSPTTAAAPASAPPASRPTRRQRRWDGPPPRHDVRWSIGVLGRVLMTVGLLMFGLVAYQLWGTGIEYRQGQDELEDEFLDVLARQTTVVATAPATAVTPSTTPSAVTQPTTPSGSEPTATVTVTQPPPTTAPGPQPQSFPPIVEGDAIARIEVAAIGLDATVVAGVSTNDLKRAPGHYPGTPLPGQLGNSAIAGHRTTYGEPFRQVDDLVPGDEIVMTTVAGRFTYRVTGTQIVGAKDSYVIDTVDPSVATLTLTSCHPEWTADERIIISALLDPADSAEPGVAILDYDVVGRAGLVDELVGEDTAPASDATDPSLSTDSPPDETAVAETPSTAPSTEAATSVAGSVGQEAPPPRTPTATSGGSADAFDQGWFDDRGAFAQVALWGVALSVIAVGAYLASRAARTNWIGLLVGIAPFVACLYFFFQNVNRLLPAAL